MSNIIYSFDRKFRMAEQIVQIFGNEYFQKRVDANLMVDPSKPNHVQRKILNRRRIENSSNPSSWEGYGFHPNATLAIVQGLLGLSTLIEKSVNDADTTRLPDTLILVADPQEIEDESGKISALEEVLSPTVQLETLAQDKMLPANDMVDRDDQTETIPMLPPLFKLVSAALDAEMLNKLLDS